MRSAFPMLWSSLSSRNNWVEKMPTSAASKQKHLAKKRRKNLLDYTRKLQPVVSFRCSQMVTAIKGFSIHRSCNVLTLSLKRFSVSSGEKILKVPEKYWNCDVGVTANAIYWDNIKNLCLRSSGCRISPVPEPATFHVSVTRGTAGVRPVCCAGPLRIQLSHRTLLLLHQGKNHSLENFYNSRNVSSVLQHFLAGKQWPVVPDERLLGVHLWH